jgi:manganese oxidase
MSHAIAFAIVFGVTAQAPAIAVASRCDPLPPVAAVTAEPNDNRHAAGSLQGGVLTLRLVARPAGWYPDGPEGCGITVAAFAEEGRAPRIPGPLVRVRAGTEVRVTIRNALERPIWIRGLQDRTAERLDSAEIAPGAEREFRYRAATAGTYYYWGGPPDGVFPGWSPTSDALFLSQLVGALVVDPPEGARDDRIFVITRFAPRILPGERLYELNAINGLSWPGPSASTWSRGRRSAGGWSMQRSSST